MKDCMKKYVLNFTNRALKMLFLTVCLYLICTVYLFAYIKTNFNTIFAKNIKKNNYLVDYNRKM